MLKKCLSILLVVILMTVLPLSVSAAQGSILVNTDAERVSVYLVGWPEGRGYRLKDTCGGGYLTYDDTLSLELAVWLHSRVREEQAWTVQGEKPSFSNLEEGLYLVWGQEAFDPFLVTIPWDGFYWALEVDPQSAPIPQTGDSVGIALLTMSASGAGMLVLSRGRKRY